MKKIILILILILILLIFRGALALEPFIDLEGEYRLQNYEENRWYYKSIGGVKHWGEDYYTELSLIGEEGEDPEVAFYTGYLEYYVGDLTLSGGRQRISWGHGFIFNLSDVFNEVDIEEPGSEGRGVDSLRLRYSIQEMSRLEFVGFKTDEKDENFAGRYTFLWEDYEFMMNYFNTVELSPVSGREEKVERYVFEVKGDMVIGVWSQISYAEFEEDDIYSLVLGGDYNFDIYGRNLYTAVEGIVTEESSGIYLTYRLRIDEAYEFYQGYIFSQGSRYINSTLSYLYNDYITLEVAYNYYHGFGELGYITKDGEELRHELVFRSKIFF